MKLPALFLLCSVVVATAAHDAEKRILGGENATLYSHPYIASLQVNEKGKWEHKCGGVIISDIWILTAAHCTKKYYDVKELSVVVGAITWDDPTNTRIRVAKIINHEDYKLYDNRVLLNNDIALLKLVRPITKSKNVDVAKLARADSHFLGTGCVISGWGRMSFGSPAASHLQEVEITKISNDECKSRLRNSKEYFMFTVNDNQICAFDKDTVTDACKGDSGGPMMCGEHHEVLVGLTSWGEPSCTTGHLPGIYTRVSRYLDWISRHITPLS